jgi:hypothetical protein
MERFEANGCVSEGGGKAEKRIFTLSSVLAPIASVWRREYRSGCR